MTQAQIFAWGPFLTYVFYLIIHTCDLFTAYGFIFDSYVSAVSYVFLFVIIMIRRHLGPIRLLTLAGTCVFHSCTHS